MTRPDTGVAVELEDGLVRVLAPNPSPMTFWGTNTYLLGRESLVVIDPGPQDEAHLAAVISAIGARVVSHILVTHSHLDHSPLAARLSRETGAPIHAFGTSRAGRSAVMESLGVLGDIGGGEGVDAGFRVDVLLKDGDTIEAGADRLTALHTPGHFGNHLCFLWKDRAFSGDHIMGWATSLVSPPDGDLTDFMASCHRLAATGVTRLYPGHGAPVLQAQTRIAELIAHRTSREDEILSALAMRPATPAQLTAAIYRDVPAALQPMAQRNVLAHLIDLCGRGLVCAPQGLRVDAKYSLVQAPAGSGEKP